MVGRGGGATAATPDGATGTELEVDDLEGGAGV